jgi:hypothetical protein
MDDHLLAKEVTAPAQPAAAQVRSAASCSVNDRESPWVTLFTGTWRARVRLLVASPDHLIRSYGQTVQACPGVAVL